MYLADTWLGAWGQVGLIQHLLFFDSKSTKMEQYIGFAVMLFLLSMICERIADFLKHFIGEQNGWQARLVKRVFNIGNTSLKGPVNSEEEDKRYYRLLKISIFCGFTTAFILHADFFTILKNLNDPTKALSWDGVDFARLSDTTRLGENIWASLKYIFGCLMTGFFISFGSKFWHDLLDLLLEVKNLKRKLVDERTFESIDTIDQFNEFIRTPESRLAFFAHEEYKAEIENTPGVISVGPGYMDDNGSRIGCLEVHFSDASALTSVKDSYPITLNMGKIVPIPVHKIVTGTAQIHAAIIGGGMLLHNETRVNGQGSAGCIVRKKKLPNGVQDPNQYLLSCFHVLSSDRDLTQKPTDTTIRMSLDGADIDIAEFTEGFRAADMDAAIALIKNSDFDFTNDMIFNPTRSRRVTSLDARRKTRVRIFGGFTGRERRGIVHNDTWPQPLDYDDIEGFQLEDLFVLTDDSTGRFRSMSVRGDSGSLVIDDVTNEALGIVLGGDLFFTYALKMSTIEKYLHVEL